MHFIFISLCNKHQNTNISTYARNDKQQTTLKRLQIKSNEMKYTCKFTQHVWSYVFHLGFHLSSSPFLPCIPQLLSTESIVIRFWEGPWELLQRCSCSDDHVYLEGTIELLVSSVANKSSSSWNQMQETYESAKLVIYPFNFLLRAASFYSSIHNLVYLAWIELW